MQQYTNTLQPTETGTVTTVVTFGPGIKEAAIDKPSAQTPIPLTTAHTPSWQAIASNISTVPFAAPAAPVGRRPHRARAVAPRQQVDGGAHHRVLSAAPARPHPAAAGHGPLPGRKPGDLRDESAGPPAPPADSRHLPIDTDLTTGKHIAWATIC